MAETREPQQKRAIEKKNRIVQAGYEMFAQKGYYNTNTAEIAKAAGVSTGIVYGYFHDKKDILIDVLDIYIAHAYQPIFDLLDSFDLPADLGLLVPAAMDAAVKIHTDNAAIHEALHSLTQHKDVEAKFMALEEEVTRRMADKLQEAGVKRDNLYEKVHWAMVSVQAYAHERVFDHHAYIDYDAMRGIVISLLDTLFEV